MSRFFQPWPMSSA